jgi:hypothetical protein
MTGSHKLSIHTVSDEFSQSANPRANDRRPHRVGFNRHRRAAFKACGRATEDIIPGQNLRHLGYSNRRSKRHPRVISDNCPKLAKHSAFGFTCYWATERDS